LTKPESRPVPSPTKIPTSSTDDKDDKDDKGKDDKEDKGDVADKDEDKVRLIFV
jgi:hypothetical protein